MWLVLPVAFSVLCCTTGSSSFFYPGSVSTMVLTGASRFHSEL